jgi:acyl carrier protein
MRRLLERVVGRLSGERPGPEPVGQPVPPPASESPVSSAAAAPAGATDPRASVIHALRRHIAETSLGRLRAEEIQEHGPLFDRGYLDSFSYVEFLAFIEQRYGVRIEDSQLAGHLTTIAAMAEHILREQTSLTD